MDWKDHFNRCAKDPIFEKKYEMRKVNGEINKVKKLISKYQNYIYSNRYELKNLELQLEKFSKEYDALIRNEENRQTHYRYGGKLSKKDLSKIEEEN